MFAEMKAEAIDYKNVAVPGRREKKLAPALHSWRSVHPFIVEMEDSKANLETLTHLLSLELNSPRPRRVIITRLHMKLNAMRRTLEFNRIIKFARD